MSDDPLKLIDHFMESMTNYNRILMVLSPIYKIKADRGEDGVGYETNIIKQIISEDISSNIIIPIILCENYDIKESTPIYLSRFRKAIMRKNYNTYELFLEEIARAILNRPKNPMPALGISPIHNSTQIENIILNKYEVAALVCIAENIPGYWDIHYQTIVDEMIKLGYKKISIEIALESLCRKGFISCYDPMDDDKNRFILESAGQDWLIENQDRLVN